MSVKPIKYMVYCDKCFKVLLDDDEEGTVTQIFDPSELTDLDIFKDWYRDEDCNIVMCPNCKEAYLKGLESSRKVRKLSRD